jgi:hypothetical protein
LKSSIKARGEDRYQMNMVRHLILFISILSFFALFAPCGQMPSDTLYSIATARSLSHGSLHIEKNAQLHYVVKGRSGYYYSKYGIGYAVLFIPSAVIASIIEPIIHIPEQQIIRAGASFTNTILATITVILFIMLLNKMCFSKKEILYTILLLMSGSLLLPYSKINHAEIPTVVVLLLFLLIWYDCPKLTIRKGLLIGIYISVLLLLKAGNVTYAITLFSCGVYCLLSGKASKYAGAALITFPFLTALFLLWFNWYRFGTLFNSGYGDEQMQFTTPLIDGLCGLLFSPSKSIFIFSPLLLLSIPGCYAAIRTHARFAIPVTVFFVFNLLFYSLWHDWHGGWAWGPRFMVPPLILMFVFIPFFFRIFANSIERSGTTLPSRVYRYTWPVQGVTVFIITFSIAINLLGALVWYQQVYYFHRDYVSIEQSHPLTAAKLFLNKAVNGREVYACSQFNTDCTTPPYSGEWNTIVHNNCIDFSTFEAFRGFSTIWGAMRYTTQSGFYSLIPLAHLLLSSGGLIFFCSERKRA